MKKRNLKNTPLIVNLCIFLMIIGFILVGCQNGYPQNNSEVTIENAGTNSKEENLRIAKIMNEIDKKENILFKLAGNIPRKGNRWDGMNAKQLQNLIYRNDTALFYIQENSLDERCDEINRLRKSINEKTSNCSHQVLKKKLQQDITWANKRINELAKENRNADSEKINKELDKYNKQNKTGSLDDFWSGAETAEEKNENVEETTEDDFWNGEDEATASEDDFWEKADDAKTETKKPNQEDVKKTDPNTVIDLDGNAYATVLIGKQVWMAENLNYKTANSWCYENDAGNCDIYGRLYTWDAAITACPDGWHLPTDGEWKTLEMFIGMSRSSADDRKCRGGAIAHVGTKLRKHRGGDSSDDGSDIYGFTALMGGSYHYLGKYGYDFLSKGEGGSWWTASKISSSEAWSRSMNDEEWGVCRWEGKVKSAYSVRCIKDN